MASVCLEGVSKVFANGAAAVKNLDLEVGDQELVVLVGPSGCGKSTTLRMIAGLESPTEGEIKIGGRVVTGAAPKDRDIAMVFQNYALYPHMTVYKNMAFGLQLRYGSNWIARIWRRVTRPAVEAEMAAQRRAIRPRVEQAAKTLGIEHLLGRMPRQLSGGERQRVALGRAIVRQPAAFLFDEPLSNLDAKLRLEMRRELNQLHRQLKATMVYVTHDQTEALTLGDRVAVMKEGEIQQIGSPLEVYDRPHNQFVAGFIGAPPMNFVSGTIRREGESLVFVGQGVRLPLTDDLAERIKAQHNQFIDREVVLGARPEDTQAAAISQPSGNPAGKGQVSVVEALGDATLVHLEIAAGPDAAAAPQNLVSKMHARVAMKPGDAVEFSIDASRAHLFDAVTGDNLSLGAG